MRRHVDGHAVDAGGEVGAVVEVEAEQEVLVGLAVARVLRDDEAGHELEHLARALRRAAAQQLALDDPLRRRIGRAHRVVVVAGHGDGFLRRRCRRGRRRGAGLGPDRGR
jgi:hypothetical protein